MKQTVEEAEKEYYEKNYPGVDINRMMVKNAFEAGALIAAEIDRLQRLK